MPKQTQTEALRRFYKEQGSVFLPDIEHGVDEQVISDLADTATHKPDHINLVINSNGGLTSKGFAIAQFIEFELTIPVHAYVSGVCYSAATYPLLCCKKRTANELSSFIIHRQTTSITIDYGEKFDSELEDWKKESEKLHQKQIWFYAKKLNISPKKTEDLLSFGSKSIDNRITAKEALKIGMPTDIVKMN
jgi:ATP-dependent protease ClpP protease subunit